MESNRIRLAAISALLIAAESLGAVSFGIEPTRRKWMARDRCAACSCQIPPGKPGRRCQSCRERSQT